MIAPTPSMLSLQGLTVKAGAQTLLDGVSLTINAGEILGLVGESGSGKSLTSLALLGLLPTGVRLTAGKAWFTFDPSHPSVDLFSLNEPELRRIRGKAVGMVFQEPAMALNPLMRCGEQLGEVLRLHTSYRGSALKAKQLALMEEVHLPDALRMLSSYPHRLSGGQRQRMMIAMAIACHPALLLADEPTTALDASVQQGVLKLLGSLAQQHNMAVLFISHDLQAVASLANHMVVLCKGRVVETGPSQQILQHPQHSYTQALVQARLQLSTPRSLLTTPPAGALAPLLTVNQLTVRYTLSRNLLGKPLRVVQALTNASLNLYSGQTLGLVGESGSGKSTLGRCVLRLMRPSAGCINYLGQPLSNPAVVRRVQQAIQVIFQDPYASLNPRRTIGQILAEPLLHFKLVSNKAAATQRAQQLLASVDLPLTMLNSYPHALSGGQRQRVCIARALAAEPQLIICDECLSALDVATQANLVALLEELQQRTGVTYLFITHDLQLASRLCHQLVVLHQGRVVEAGPTQQVLQLPQATYTQLLVAASSYT